MIKIGIVKIKGNAQSETGMELYRLVIPYGGIAEDTSNYSVNAWSINDIRNCEDKDLDCDIYVFNRLHYIDIAEKVKRCGKKLIIDIDDIWTLDRTHTLFNDPRTSRYPEELRKTFALADLVTTSTPLLAEKILEEFGIVAQVVKNTIPENFINFNNEKVPHDRLRFGWVGGVFHTKDIELMKEGIEKIYATKNIQKKYQFILGGFNFNQEYVDYEKIFTSNYKLNATWDGDYMEYLKNFTPMGEHIGQDKQYRRLWGRDVDTYGRLYRHIDVALIPLQDSPFSNCKSELKLIEAGMTGCAAIVSNVLPYSNYLTHDNCYRVNTANDWHMGIRTLLNDKEYRQDLIDNLAEDVREHFNHKVEVANLKTHVNKLV